MSINKENEFLLGQIEDLAGGETIDIVDRDRIIEQVHESKTITALVEQIMRYRKMEARYMLLGRILQALPLLVAPWMVLYPIHAGVTVMLVVVFEMVVDPYSYVIQMREYSRHFEEVMCEIIRGQNDAKRQAENAKMFEAYEEAERLLRASRAL